MFEFLSAAMPVLKPVLSAIIVEIFFLWIIKRRDGKVEFCEIGVIFSSVILIYTILPALTFFASGLAYTPLSDTRLFKAQPSPAELAPIFWYYVLYLASFAWAYIHFRGSSPLKGLAITKPGPKLIWILVCGYLSIRLFFVLVRAIWNIQSAETYGEEYLVYRNLPLFLQQLANHLGWMSLTTELLLMVALTLNYRKYRIIIFCWLAVEFLSIIFFGVGSRTGLMMVLMTLAITYHLFVKRFKPRSIGLLSLAGLLLFLGLGVARMLSSAYAGDPDLSLLGSTNEFEGLFANAYDLRELKATGQTAEIFPRLYFSDLANLVPQQVMPFKKIDLGDWYVQSFYTSYADVGGAFAFGVIPESIVGLGWIDLIWRGLLVGWVFSYIYRRFVINRKSFWNYSFYLWVTIFSYQTFRTTTFILIPHAVYDVLTVMLGVDLIPKFLDWQPHQPPSQAQAEKLPSETS